MQTVRGGSGFGDAIYVQGVVRHLVRTAPVEVLTNWPDVFRPLAGKVKLAPFARRRVDRIAHYSSRRGVLATTQFEDCCIQAGIRERIELRLDWDPLNVELVRGLRANAGGRPVIVVQMPRAPFGRSDGFGMEFLPDCRVIQRAIAALEGRAFVVQVGKGEPLFGFRGIDLDLTNRTSVSDLIDVGYAADGFLGYCSFIIPLAECFAKPVTLVWSRRGLDSAQPLIRQMVPQKMLLLPTSRAVVDDCAEAELLEAVDALLATIRTPALV